MSKFIAPVLVFSLLGWATIGAAPFSCGKKDAGSSGSGTCGAGGCGTPGAGGGDGGRVAIGSQTHSAETHQAQATSALENAQKASKAAQQTATQINAAVKSIVKSIDDAQAKQASPFHFAPIDLLAPVPPANAPLPGLGGGPVNAAPALDATALINKVTEMDQHLGEQVKATDEAKKTGLKDSSKDTNTQLKDSVGKAAKAVTDASVTVKSEIGNLTTAASKVTGGAAPLQTPAQNLAPLLAALGKQVDEVNGNATKAVTELGAALDAQLKAEALKRQQELLKQERAQSGLGDWMTPEDFAKQKADGTLPKAGMAILFTGGPNPFGGSAWCGNCTQAVEDRFESMAQELQKNGAEIRRVYVPNPSPANWNAAFGGIAPPGVPEVTVINSNGQAVGDPLGIDKNSSATSIQDLLNTLGN